MKIIKVRIDVLDEYDLYVVEDENGNEVERVPSVKQIAGLIAGAEWLAKVLEVSFAPEATHATDEGA